jgi:hypothetical protein
MATATKAKKKTTKKKTKKKTKAEQEALANEAEWERLLEQKAQEPFHSYKMDSSYTLGDKLKHPKFGEGVVDRLVYPNKIAVIFQDAERVLIHAGPAAEVLE